ncbi:hypothetical protein [Streptomyces bambusae]|uniref:Uncharacterized protein n=1 Tax=Streptomyces bambusae TaxID=1550616 RepID=A0ABS6ZDC8_9ACTN|nr:hypothetical protein [Streptomyces bambusae]MBW5485223.1 hypothetical protein [Streptomyces bambusae]
MVDGVAPVTGRGLAEPVHRLEQLALHRHGRRTGAGAGAVAVSVAVSVADGRCWTG